MIVKSQRNLLQNYVDDITKINFVKQSQEFQDFIKVNNGISRFHIVAEDN